MNEMYQFKKSERELEELLAELDITTSQRDRFGEVLRQRDQAIAKMPAKKGVHISMERNKQCVPGHFDTIATDIARQEGVEASNTKAHDAAELWLRDQRKKP